MRIRARRVAEARRSGGPSRPRRRTPRASRARPARATRRAAGSAGSRRPRARARRAPAAGRRGRRREGRARGRAYAPLRSSAHAPRPRPPRPASPPSSSPDAAGRGRRTPTARRTSRASRRPSRRPSRSCRRPRKDKDGTKVCADLITAELRDQISASNCGKVVKDAIRETDEVDLDGHDGDDHRRQARSPQVNEKIGDDARPQAHDQAGEGRREVADLRAAAPQSCGRSGAELAPVLALVVLAVLAGADRLPPPLVVAVPGDGLARAPRRSAPAAPSRARAPCRRRASSGGRGRGGR